jgi:YggT family protein
MPIASVLITLIDVVVRVFVLVLLVRAVLSWVRVDPYHPLVRFLYNITEPVLEPIRRILPRTGMFDFSLLVAMIAALALQRLLTILILALFA